jgi:hypothetical protein
MVMQQITWVPVILFLSILAAFAFIDHLRSRDRRRSARARFQRMQSPYARPRHRSQKPSARAAFTQPYHAAARRGFTR